MSIRHPALCLTLFALVGCGPPALVEADVSFLVPLTRARALRPSHQLLPRALFDSLGALTVVDEPDALYAALGIVGVRLDACFQEGSPPSPCAAQVRLVLQPVFEGPNGLTTRDAALHLFYPATAQALTDAVAELARARERAKVPAGDDSGVHPALESAEVRRAFAERVAPLLDPAKLTRVTSMSVHASNEAWVFSGLTLAGGKAAPLALPTLPPDDPHQHITSLKTELAVTIDPASSVEPSMGVVIAPDALPRSTTQQLEAAAAAIARLEDPAAHNPGTVDCGACHLAAVAQRVLTKQGTRVETPAPASDVFDDPRNLRAFGYFFERPAFSPRARRETRAVLADFTRRLSGRP